MVQLNRRWAPHRSEGNPSCITTPFDTSSLHSNVQLLTSSLPPLYTPFLYSLSTYSTLSIDQPPFDTPSLHSNSKLHLYLLSTPPSYIPSLHTQHCRILSWYSSIAAGLPTGQKTTHPV